MKINISTTFFQTGLMMGALMCVDAFAKVSPEEAAQLGKTLTPLGAEQAGNSNGTIPPWTGGINEKPACDDGSTFPCNPFAEDKPLFTITVENRENYKKNLSPGQWAMFDRYPQTFKMPVFKTRRTARYSEKLNQETAKNAVNTVLAEQGNGVKDYTVGIPFPIPKNGLEVYWNHVLRFKGEGGERITGQAVPQADGKYTLILLLDRFMVRPFLPDALADEDANVMVFVKEEVVSPARFSGNILLAHDTIDQAKEPRKGWIYNAGQRRVRRAPQISYDGPGNMCDGMCTIDNFDMINGAPDRYDWKLIGKQELYIPYNSYKLEEKGLKYADIIQPGHVNSALTRYELHRVWVVDTQLKPGKRHIYSRRTLYVDEDTWQAGIIDHYDVRNSLWRLSEAHEMQYYNYDAPLYAVSVINDLSSGRYVITGMENEEAFGVDLGKRFPRKEFSPNELRNSGIR